MKYYGEILLCIVIIVVIVVGQVYLGLDKFRARANVFINRMQEDLDTWVTLTVELAGLSGTDTEAASEMRDLADEYFKCKRYKARFLKVPLVNKMRSLSGRPPVGSEPGAEAGRVQTGRRDAVNNLEPLLNEYNLSVKKLNNRLDKKIYKAVGKLFHVQKLEELRDLS